FKNAANNNFPKIKILILFPKNLLSFSKTISLSYELSSTLLLLAFCLQLLTEFHPPLILNSFLFLLLKLASHHIKKIAPTTLIPLFYFPPQSAFVGWW
ncbi:hypothetical protein LINGRAHAP2_LOCUS23791, partial [Linum grandiflorum]